MARLTSAVDLRPPPRYSHPMLPTNRPLKEADPVLAELIAKERIRQTESLELIASENFTSAAVQNALGSCLTNKYSEGLPGKRYYGGNEVIDEIESLAISRALAAFNLSPDEWGVNVQPYSGSVANFAALTAIAAPGDVVIGLALNAGGHLTHGHQSEGKKISATAIYFTAVQYGLDEKGYINYDQVDQLAVEHKAKVIIAGGSAYPRDWDYARMRASADKVGAVLMCDMAHYAGLVAGGEHTSPFQYCDIVTTTTHKSLRGPRAAMIFFRRSHPADLEKAVNFAVFPTTQGGPHEHQIAAIATACLEAATPEFKEYARSVKANMQTLCESLIGYGYTIQTGGSENHLCLLDVRDKGLTGSKVEKVCDLAHITINKNMVVGDKSALTPGGVRLGSPALTSRGLKQDDFKKVAELIHRCIQIAIRVQGETGPKLVDFLPAVEKDQELAALREEVRAFARSFPIPGY